MSVVQAQTPDWKAELGEDIVQIRGDKMMMEEYALLKLNVEGQKTNNLQVKLYAEAPKDGIISRDNFVNLTSMITYMSLLEIYARAYQLSASEYLQAVDIEQIPNPIGTPDIELNLTATNAGLQIEFVNTADNQRRRVTRTWEEMYAE
ncbi:hypothetical protein [Longibacter salinarum]|uniref:hypothetical protein n=1 Tax=Longibacter salinarum TaxID=1850348 RepID=UPI0011800840|nr:hypothetical protein [Longibacter salinarum]